MEGGKRELKMIRRRNIYRIYLSIGMKVDGTGWKSNCVFSDVHELGRFVKKEIGEEAVRVAREDYNCGEPHEKTV